MIRPSKRARRLVLTTLVAAGAAVLGPSYLPDSGLVAPAMAQQVKPEELAADYENSLKFAAKESAKAYESLWKWCKDKKLDFTAINCRRLVLRYDPDNEEVRKYVGYARTAEGWIRNEARRDAIREEADVEDPKAQKFPEKIASTNKSVLGKWKALANKAKKNSEIDAANAATWIEKATAAWERVLQVDSSNEEAHKALNHPKFNGKYCRPEAQAALKVRDERKQGGLKRANAPAKTSPGEYSDLMKRCNIVGGAAKSEHFVVSSVNGKDAAAETAAWGERTLADFIAIYCPNGDLAERANGLRFSYVKDIEQFKSCLVTSGMPAPDVEKLTKYASGTTVGTEHLAVGPNQPNANDHVAHFSGHDLTQMLRNIAVQEVGSPNEGIEDWLQESIAYDMTRRLMGTTQWMCVAFGKYGNDIEPNPEKDIWIELAKRLVEFDDDVPMSRLYRLKREDQTIRGPETVKGYAFLQFLFETDQEKARKFVMHALAQGTPRAVEELYSEGVVIPDDPGAEGRSKTGNPADRPHPILEDLDAKYRKWILATW